MQLWKIVEKFADDLRNRSTKAQKLSIGELSSGTARKSSYSLQCEHEAPSIALIQILESEESGLV